MTPVAPTEQALYLPAGEAEIFGVLAHPTGPSRGVGVIILSGGRYEQSSGRNRVARRMAHSFATAGFHCLRIDYHGIGDSSGRVGEFALHEPFVDDVAAAITALHDNGVERVVLVGDCFGARTALASAATLDAVAGAFLVSLPWRDMRRSDRKVTIASSELSVGDYVRKGLSRRVMASLTDPKARRTYIRLVAAKLRQLRVSARDKLEGIELEPWVSRGAVSQLEAVAERPLPLMLLYGTGVLEEYTHEFEVLRSVPALAHLLGPESPFEISSIDRPIAGYRNVAAQDEVMAEVNRWLDDTFPFDEAVA